MLNIAIVGLGPKGLYAFARLVDSLTQYPSTGITILLYEKSGKFGTGPIYDIDQPDYLLMNYENAHIDHSHLYFDSYERCFTSFRGGKSGFSSRASVGLYLKDLFDKTMEKARKIANVILIKAELSDMVIHDNCFLGQCLNGDRTRWFNYILLTTGHGTYVDENARYPFLYPLSKSLSHITKEDIVLVKGLGLTFIDVALELTEGRGGKFEERDGELIYLPSGNEVQQIIPYSRSGLFMLPRETTIIPKDFELLNSDLTEILSNDHKVDFEDEILPALEREFNLQKGYDDNSVNGSSVFRQILGAIGLTLDTTINEEYVLVGFIWRKFAPIFNELYKSDQLTAESYRVFDSKWKSTFQKLCYGPPLHNYRKLKALEQHGILNLTYVCNPNIDLKNKKISNSYSDEHYTQMIEAIIPSSSTAYSPSPLIKNMVEEGILSFTSRTQNEHMMINISKKGFAIDMKGNELPEIAISGIPSEGTSYNNDTLSTDYNDYTQHWIENIIKFISHDKYATIAHSE